MIVGLAGAVISVGALPVSSVKGTSGRTFLALGLLVLHLVACVAYYVYVQSNPADANAYYFDKLHYSSAPFALGTVFVGKITQVLRTNLGGSFLECFIFFQAIGFWGIMILMRTFQEIQFKMRVSETTLPYYLLFIPGIQFWTVAIGKDAPLFFAVSLCVWCLLELRKRLILFAVSLLVMVAFRAHIALIVMTSLAAAAFLHSKISFGRKAGLLGVALIGVALLASTVSATLNVDVTDTSSLENFLQEREDIAARIGGQTTIGDVSIPIRFLSLLYRPFFVDAGNWLGTIASFENVGSLLLTIYLVKNWRSVVFLTRRVFFARFCLILSIVLITLLALVYYNIGLGLRQRTMVLPALLSLFVALWAMPRASRSFEPAYVQHNMQPYGAQAN
jgi:hypothetical protein